MNQSLSMFNKKSVIARLNRGETDQVDSLFVRMFTKAGEVYKETGGAFDITVAPLHGDSGLEMKDSRRRKRWIRYCNTSEWIK